jgi:lipopolysaccharide/colanic/teichoic acid biosynthesis glycosyltransferase
MKRLFDLLLSSLALVALSPLYFILALLIRRDGGPAFFRQARVGQSGELFRIFKFRSMIPGAEKLGAQVTGAADPRITSVGRFLRKTKLDELPQLINVFLGQMSLVGPRPEVPRYVDRWPEEDRQQILQVKPGITDYATFYYNDEQAVLARAEDPEKAYLETVLPHKLRLYRRYLQDRSFGLDLRLLLATLARMIGLNGHLLLPRQIRSQLFNHSKNR